MWWAIYAMLSILPSSLILKCIERPQIRHVSVMAPKYSFEIR